ncbi:hypothetical protein I5Q34_00930 [Streptomyces sp. AV19]|uniref:hypothetical protein n=1 Tax=Streptomyces sp. AV19 TaxID=2793068 RepID=UPI0018FE5134|nr:hypothetical protein [Streptomyces sp. AV19]MBH1932870.1 hypothetical protein [Streptomyces sp. AV19]MDG4531548.1 hypothetical protein [Streptomyces sp. AV19]
MRPSTLLRTGLGLSTAIAILSATVLPAYAASDAPAAAPQATQVVQTSKDTTAVGWLSDAERKALAPFVSYGSGRYSLDAKGAQAAGISQKAIDAVKTAVARLDTLVDKNLAVSKDSEGVVVDPTTAAIAPRSGETQIVEGITVKVTWFGLLIHLDPFVTGKVQAGVDITKDLVQVVTSVVTIASLGSLLPATMLVAALTDLGSKVVSFCTTRKGELYVYVTWAGVPVCNPFA